MKEREGRGWSLTKGSKDLDEKANPHLVPWEELTDRDRERVRSMVREIPAILSEVGFQVYRVSNSGPAESR
jgi:hypothetical protein